MKYFNDMLITIGFIPKGIAKILIKAVDGKIVREAPDGLCDIQLFNHRIRTTVDHITIINNITNKQYYLSYEFTHFITIQGKEVWYG